MKVLHLPTQTGGMAWGLAQGEKKLGIDSKVLVTSDNWLDYPYDISLDWSGKSCIDLLLKHAKAFIKYRNIFDVFHFNFGRSLIDLHEFGVYHWDLPLYPKDKKIIFTYNGCDARQKFKTMERADISACSEEDCYQGICNNGKLDRMRKKSINIVSKYSDHIFAVNPDLLYFLPKEKSSFLPYAVSRWYEIKSVTSRIEKKITIMHSPTDRSAKGSHYIIPALEKLKEKYNIEVVIVEKMKHKDALEVYRKADIVIDQILVGWYGAFAVEAMKMGKPVAVYIREEDLKFIPDQMAEDLKDAVININIHNIEEVLEIYLQDSSLLIQKSQAGLDYVNKWHDPEYVAGITKVVYER